MKKILKKEGVDLTENEKLQIKESLLREFKVGLPPKDQLANSLFFFLVEDNTILSMEALLKTEPVMFNKEKFTIYGLVNVVANVKK